MTKIANGIQHIGIPTNNIDKTIEFYEMIGFEVAYQTLNNGEKVAFLKLGNMIVETYENGKGAHKSGAIDHIALDTDDIEVAYKYAIDKGMELDGNGIQFLPFWDNGVKFFKVIGPNREMVEFSQML